MKQRVIVKEVGKEAKVVFVEQRNDCEEYYKLIGNGCDMVDYMRLEDSVYMLCDDDGRDKYLEHNFELKPYYNDNVVGTAVFVGVINEDGEDGEEAVCGLNDKQIEKVTKWLKQ